jgi:hypothetical protein
MIAGRNPVFDQCNEFGAVFDQQKCQMIQLSNTRTRSKSS